MMSSMDPEKEIKEVATLADPRQRARRAHDLFNQLQDLSPRVSELRMTALRELQAAGVEQKEMAVMLGITASRISKILASGIRPERALVGTGAVTISAGGKLETGRSNPSVVISTEALAAVQIIEELCRDYDLAVHHEVVGPPGIVRLNRDNLVVMCSPRLLPIVTQVLEADPNLGFGVSAQGWYLTDHTTGTVYRSPSDKGVPADFGYIGRLPRPDGHGSFLYLAGIHAPGTLGVAHHLAAHAEEIYRQVKTRRFSMLIECQFDPDTHAITATSAVTPIYRQEGT